MTEETKSSTTASGAPRPEYRSYGDIVWEQFQKYPLSYYSVWGVVALFAIAVACPIFAFDIPFYINVPEGASTQVSGAAYPWFAGLFDTNVFDSGVDIFFNTMLVATPFVVAAWFIMKKTSQNLETKAKKARATKFIWGVIIVTVLAAFGLYFGDFRQPYVDWVALSKVEGASSVFPPFQFSYRLPDITNVQSTISSTNWLGTDEQGRDVFTRLLYGTRISLTIGVVAVSIYTSIGVVLGAVGGYFGGIVDNIILRMIEVMLCFPTLFLILTLRGFIDEPSIFYIMLIIGVTGWTRIARLVRGEFLRLKNEDFVQSAIALGYTKSRIIFRHILPNALGPVFVAAAFGVAGAILIEATLSFLGLGAPGAPSWGQILTTGRMTGQAALIFAPGFAIFVTVSFLNLVGEGARDALDPKMRK